MCLKKLLFILLLLSLLSVPAFSQDQSQQSSDLWNSIEWNLNFLESEQLFSQTRLAELEQKLEQSEKACQDKELLLQNCESLLEKSKQDTKRWKTCSIVLGTTTMTLGISTVVLIAVMVNSK